MTIFGANCYSGFVGFETAKLNTEVTLPMEPVSSCKP